jgi:hypothetical protein
MAGRRFSKKLLPEKKLVGVIAHRKIQKVADV